MLAVTLVTHLDLPPSQPVPMAKIFGPVLVIIIISRHPF